MIEQVLPNIYRIHVPLPGNPLKELNSYLIKGAGRALLIDTGFRQEVCRIALQQALDELGVKKEETDILLTHLHADHSGLSDLFVGNERHIFVSETDKRFLESDAVFQELSDAQDRRYRAEQFPEEELNALIWKNPARALTAPRNGKNFLGLRHGDTLEAAGYRLKAILTPGHTPGHMCFWLENYGAMFLGDHVLFDITPNITFWPDVSDSLGAYLNSLKTIRSYDVELPLPAHRTSGAFKNRVNALLTHHDQRLEEVYNIVKEHPGCSAYEIAGWMTWNIRCRAWESFPVAQKWFAVGECLSHLDRLLVTGEIYVSIQKGVRYYYVG